MENREYFKQWYEDNKADYNRLRKERYRTDPNYRAIVQERNRLSREKAKARAKQEKASKPPAEQPPVDRTQREVRIGVLEDGTVVTETLLTIGALAWEIDRSVQAIRLWEREGIISPTPIRSPRGDRLYTKEQVEEIRKILTERGKIGPNTSRAKPSTSTIKKVRLSSGAVKEIKLFKVGVLARALGRSVVALEQLEKLGFFPETPLRAGKISRYRLYSDSMIDEAKKALDSLGGDLRGREARETFHSKVSRGWERLDLLDAEIIS